ncbi:YceD family protein [Sphingomonas profundi]|uniref:YceD family protein n=1 Tax=Alterirhizorhabdus profundi TaxID=2681549 RepID=UPI0012E86CC1|nr:DUF177 domain-containing protein [Sphingomonas profundi]
MTAAASEFPRPVRIDTIGEAERAITVTADEAERAALARRFDLVAIDRLSAEIRVRRAGEIVHAEGVVSAAVTQSCVATGAPLAATLAVPLELRFVPEPFAAAQDEIELDAADCDTVGYDGGAIDVGEAAAETLYLALDPFPRAHDADAVLKAAGVIAEEDAGPFAALKGLRDRLGE